MTKTCSHVTCKTCTDTLVRPAKQCIVCDAQLKDSDIIELKREGIYPTGLPTPTYLTSLRLQALVSLVGASLNRPELGSLFKASRGIIYVATVRAFDLVLFISRCPH